MNRIRKAIDTLKWAQNRTSRELHARLDPIKRRFATPQMPKRADGKLLIHLGCGSIAGKDFLNVDGQALPHVHHVADVTKLPMFERGVADLVYACHVFEHFEPSEHRIVLWEWARVLKPGGTLRIAVPDFDKLVAIYQAMDGDVSSIWPMLMGTYEGYSPHRAIFNEAFLRGLMEQAGLIDVRIWDPNQVEHHDFEDWASRPVVRAGKNWPISLNLEGDKAP